MLCVMCSFQHHHLSGTEAKQVLSSQTSALHIAAEAKQLHAVRVTAVHIFTEHGDSLLVRFVFPAAKVGIRHDQLIAVAVSSW